MKRRLTFLLCFSPTTRGRRLLAVGGPHILPIGGVIRLAVTGGGLAGADDLPADGGRDGSHRDPGRQCLVCDGIEAGRRGTGSERTLRRRHVGPAPVDAGGHISLLGLAIHSGREGRPLVGLGQTGDQGQGDGDGQGLTCVHGVLLFRLPWFSKKLLSIFFDLRFGRRWTFASCVYPMISRKLTNSSSPAKGRWCVFAPEGYSPHSSFLILHSPLPSPFAPSLGRYKILNTK